MADRNLASALKISRASDSPCRPPNPHSRQAHKGFLLASIQARCLRDVSWLVLGHAGFFSIIVCFYHEATHPFV
jgi:hypothetical protein